MQKILISHYSYCWSYLDFPPVHVSCFISFPSLSHSRYFSPSCHSLSLSLSLSLPPSLLVTPLLLFLSSHRETRYVRTRWAKSNPQQACPLGVSLWVCALTHKSWLTSVDLCVVCELCVLTIPYILLHWHVHFLPWSYWETTPPRFIRQLSPFVFHWLNWNSL